MAKDLVGLKVAVDVGHGMYKDETGTGWEPGAVGNGFQEYTLNKTEALEIKRLLEERGAVCNVFMYPPGSEALSLGFKGEKAKGHNLFVSVHHNAYDKKTNYTCCMLAYENKNFHTPEDVDFARVLAEEISAHLGFKNAGTLRYGGGLFWNRKSMWSSVKAACLTESFFIETSQLAGQDLVALAKKAAGGTVNGIARYARHRGLVDLQSPVSPQPTKPAPEPTPPKPTQPSKPPNVVIQYVIDILEKLIAYLKSI